MIRKKLEVQIKIKKKQKFCQLLPKSQIIRKKGISSANKNLKKNKFQLVKVK